MIDVDGISLFLNVKKPVQRPFARFEVFVDSGNGLIDLKYINKTIDMCRFFREKTYMPFLQIIYRTVVDQGNYPTSCPIRQVIILLIFDLHKTLTSTSECQTFSFLYKYSKYLRHDPDSHPFLNTSTRYN